MSDGFPLLANAQPVLPGIGVLLTDLLENIELVTRIGDAKLKRIIFRKASRTHGYFLSSNAHARLDMFAAIGLWAIARFFVTFTWRDPSVFGPFRMEQLLDLGGDVRER